MTLNEVISIQNCPTYSLAEPGADPFLIHWPRGGWLDCPFRQLYLHSREELYAR